MSARTCRYSGSGAVMTSELVAGSAWMKPPVEGSAAVARAPPALAVLSADALGVVTVLLGALRATAPILPPPLAPPLPRRSR